MLNTIYRHLILNQKFHKTVLLCTLSLPLQAATTIISTIGDSITAGVGASPEVNIGNGCYGCGGYQPYLHNQMNSGMWSASIYNHGIAGEGSGSGASRVTSVLNTNNSNYLLYMEGTNNLWFYSPQSVKEDYRSVISNVLGRGKIPIIGTITPDTRGSNNSIKNIPTTNALIVSLANEYSIQVADLYNATSNWSSLMPDGLHPNNTGYRIMADAWYQTILKTKQSNVAIAPILSILLLD